MNKSTSNLKKRRKIKIKTQRGGIFFKCYDKDGKMKRKWMPCSYSKLSKVNPKISQPTSHKDNASESQSKTTRNRRSVGSTMSENFDAFMYGPRKEEKDEFLNFVRDTPCCRDFETKVVEKYFTPVTNKNLSILRFIVVKMILLNYAGEIERKKQRVLEHLLSKLDKEESKRSGIFSRILHRNRKTLKGKIVEDEIDKYKEFLEIIEQFHCSEEDCSEFANYLSSQVKDTFFFHCLEHIQLHEILPKDASFALKRRIIEEILTIQESQRRSDVPSEFELKKRSDNTLDGVQQEPTEPSEWGSHPGLGWGAQAAP